MTESVDSVKRQSVFIALSSKRLRRSFKMRRIRALGQHNPSEQRRAEFIV